MRYRFTQINRQGNNYILVEPFGDYEGEILRKLIQKHDPINSNVIVVKRDSNNRTVFHGIGEHRVNVFNPGEEFFLKDWKFGEIDL